MSWKGDIKECMKFKHILLAFFVLALTEDSSSDLCKKRPRPPTSGCCPTKYLSLCCVDVPPCDAAMTRPPRTAPVGGGTSGTTSTPISPSSIIITSPSSTDNKTTLATTKDTKTSPSTKVTITTLATNTTFSPATTGAGTSSISSNATSIPVSANATTSSSINATLLTNLSSTSTLSPTNGSTVSNSSSRYLYQYGSFNNSSRPGKPRCSPPWDNEGCRGGYYDSNNGTVKPCPPGFYCPELLTCIRPCPQGAYCRRLERKTMKMKQQQLTRQCEIIGICCVKKDGTFLPPALIDQDYVCPGKSIPDPCPKRYYCPDPVTKKICPEGHYCQEGTVVPKKCPLLTTCNKGESAPTKNAAGPLLAILIILCFIAIYLGFVYRNEIRYYAAFYRGKIAKKKRSFSRAFSLEAGIKGFVNKMTDIEDGIKREQILPKDFTMDIGFKELTLALKSRGNKLVLSGVTGAINSGEVTAIMGPSGAGKTTFLNTLSGKAYYGHLGGHITVNGMDVNDLKKYRKITGFVPQEDIMHRKLTVEEVLLYQARLRLPSSISQNEIKKKVTQVLELLEICHVRHVPIGDEETRGISGGQRKRVNIGMELVADPTLLFLDEPTSGLDSTSSLSVLRVLRAVAEQGKLTVVCVIHQPRYEIFSMFHKLLFLGPGGRTVFQGTVDEATDYFKKLGFVVPPNINPADFYMDVIGGVDHEGTDDFNPNVLFDAWTRHNLELDANANVSADDIEVEPKSTTLYRTKEFKTVSRPMPNVFMQFWIFLEREIFLLFRYIKSVFFDLTLVLIAGGALGGLYSEVTLEKLSIMNTMSSYAIGLTAILSSLRCFGNHRTTFWREAATGINRFSYFLAVNICQLPLVLFTPLVYLSLQYTFTAPRALFKHHYYVVVLTQWACTGIGYAISCIFHPRNSQMAAVVFVLISSLFAGAVPSVCQLEEYKIFGPVATRLSYCYWFLQALFEKEVERVPEVMRTTVDFIAYANNYTLDRYSICLGWLFMFGIVTRVLAFLFMIFTNRGKQK